MCEKNLKVPILSHAEYFPNLCHICGQKYADMCMLNRHLRLHDEGVKLNRHLRYMMRE